MNIKTKFSRAMTLLQKITYAYLTDEDFFELKKEADPDFTTTDDEFIIWSIKIRKRSDGILVRPPNCIEIKKRSR